jgi:hypothetical protein
MTELGSDTLKQWRKSAMVWSVLGLLVLACTGDLLKRQGLVITDAELALGTTPITIAVATAKGLSSNCFLILHSDEDTGIEAALDHISANGGKAIILRNGHRRNVTFQSSDGQKVSFDPNRIFTEAGLRKDLAAKNTGLNYEKDSPVLGEVDKLARKILSMLDECKRDPIIAVHNNANEHAVGDTIERGFGINSYRIGGSEERNGNTRNLPGNPNTITSEDPDNFFLVTDKRYFDRIKTKYNVVLQASDNNSTLPNGEGPYDDGSLSVKFKRGRYINLEVQYGNKDAQMKMLADLERMLIVLISNEEKNGIK